MDATTLSNEIRELIDHKTLAAGLGEEDACSMAKDALDETSAGYEMRLSELSEE